jgi:pyruvate dehydrogenase E2 component (dihydrolipoamide acetyltransferase)
VFISPRARVLAEDRGLAWSQLRGTGPEGAIVERDVRAALDRPAAARPIAADRSFNEALETIPVTGVRGIIAARMAASSNTAANVTLTTETDATAFVELRATLAAHGVAVTYNDLLMAALGRALREHPRMNASLDGDTIRVWKRIHVGLAVDTERGLIVPVVRDVDQKRVGEIAQESARVVAAARNGTAQPEELREGTFTLTNLGMFRIDAFTPIINMPECAVLGVGRIKPRPQLVDGAVVERRMMWLSLTFDHRLVDGGPAARFLQRVAELVEQPLLLLI